MWVTRSEREWSRKLEAETLAEAAASAEARFAAVTGALGVLLADSRAAPMLSRHGIHRVALGRSMRVAGNGRAEGLAVLEGVVLAGMVRSLLADADLVRWLACHHPGALAALHGACGKFEFGWNRCCATVANVVGRPATDGVQTSAPPRANFAM